MTASRAANIAIALVLVGWGLVAFAVLSSLGDPAPWVSKSQLNAIHNRAMFTGLLGTLCLLSVVWLSGYSASLARVRASAALAGVVIPLVVCFWYGFM
jgi:hypothetical protein